MIIYSLKILFMREWVNKKMDIQVTSTHLIICKLNVQNYIMLLTDV
jgi:hypothetical protein